MTAEAVVNLVLTALAAVVIVGAVLAIALGAMLEGFLDVNERIGDGQ